MDTQLKCVRCEHEWNSRVEHPKQCPKCRSPYWNRAVVRVSVSAARRGAGQTTTLAVDNECIRIVAIADAAPEVEPFTVNWPEAEDEPEFVSWWPDEWPRVLRLIQGEDPNSGYEELASMTGGFRGSPALFKIQSARSQAVWLDENHQLSVENARVK